MKICPNCYHIGEPRIVSPTIYGCNHCYLYSSAPTWSDFKDDGCAICGIHTFGYIVVGANVQGTKKSWLVCGNHCDQESINILSLRRDTIDNIWDCSLVCEEGKPIKTENGWKVNVYENMLTEEMSISKELEIGERVRYA